MDGKILQVYGSGSGKTPAFKPVCSVRVGSLIFVLSFLRAGVME